MEGYIIFACKEKGKGLLHTTIKPTKEQCYHWAKKRNLPHIEECCLLADFLKRPRIGNNS